MKHSEDFPSLPTESDDEMNETSGESFLGFGGPEMPGGGSEEESWEEEGDDWEESDEDEDSDDGDEPEEEW